MRRHTVPTLLLAALALTGGVGCGSDSDSAATSEDSAAVEARITRERADAAKSARQDERIKQLEAEAVKTRKAKSGSARVRTVTTPAPAPAPAPPARTMSAASKSGGDDWPGGSGQTVILASVASESQARSVQRRASMAGLDAGVLYSSDYSSLRPGYWVAFSGKFDTTGQRQSRARSAGFGDAYARFVSR